MTIIVLQLAHIACGIKNIILSNITKDIRYWKMPYIINLRDGLTATKSKLNLYQKYKFSKQRDKD